MSESPLSAPGAKAALVLSMVLTMLGFSGMLSGYSILWSDIETVHTEGVSTAVEETLDELRREQFRSPISKGLAVANLLASGMLTVAGFLITTRRRSALWWTGQALGANFLYTVAETVGRVVLNQRLAPRIEDVFIAYAATQPTAPEGPSPAELAPAAPWIVSCFTVVLGLLLLAIYVVLIRHSRRKDVRSFILRE